MIYLAWIVVDPIIIEYHSIKLEKRNIVILLKYFF